MAADNRTVELTVAVVTRNRRQELARALNSIKEQDCSPEIIVVDDASDDGTSEMLAEDFPDVRRLRRSEPAGPALGRNQAMALAAGDVVVCIDDDAWFESTRTLRQTLDAFDHPRVAVVTIPFEDVVGDERIIRQEAPLAPGRWITATFIGAAYAMRKEAFTQVGGYQETIRMYSEEADLSLRLLDAGYVTQLGRADHAVHQPSTVRSLYLMDTLGRRHEIVRVWSSFPAPWHLLYLAGYTAKGLMLGVRVRRFRAMSTGIRQGLCLLPKVRRRPVSGQAFRLDRRLRRHYALEMSAVEDQLPPLHGAGPA